MEAQRAGASVEQNKTGKGKGNLVTKGFISHGKFFEQDRI